MIRKFEYFNLNSIVKKRKLIFLKQAFWAFFLKKRIPLMIGWSLTSSCNLKCPYCSYWRQHQKKEIETEKIFSIIDEMYQINVRRIRFTGGEPLLRTDLPYIIEYCKKRGIHVSIGTNGTLLKRKFNDIKLVDMITISLDGPQEVHDAIRGKGTYKKVMEGIELCKKYNIKFQIDTVISSMNLKHLHFILSMARNLKVFVFFQPVTLNELDGTLPNPLVPRINELRWVMKDLIKEKISNRYIGNSMACLKYYLNWPHGEIICNIDRVFARLQADGQLYTCFYRRKSHRNCVEDGFKNAFRVLDRGPFKCSQCCWTARVELNLALSGNLDAILNLLKVNSGQI